MRRVHAHSQHIRSKTRCRCIFWVWYNVIGTVIIQSAEQVFHGALIPVSAFTTTSTYLKSSKVSKLRDERRDETAMGTSDSVDNEEDELCVLTMVFSLQRG